MSYTHLIQRVLEKDGWSGFLTRGLKTKCEFLHFAALAQHQCCKFVVPLRTPSSSITPIGRLLTNAISGIGFTIAWQFIQEWMDPSWG